MRRENGRDQGRNLEDRDQEYRDQDTRRTEIRTPKGKRPGQ